MSFLLKARSEPNQSRSPSSEELQEKTLPSAASSEQGTGARSRPPSLSKKLSSGGVSTDLRKFEDIAEKDYEGRRAYIADYLDAKGRCVLVSKPAIKAKVSGKEQIKYLVYILEILAMNSADEQEEHVTCLLDCKGWAISNTPLSITRESINIVQNYYPGMIAVAILSNTPRIFESFWKVKFVYTNNPESQKIVFEMFDMDKLETAFGGRNELTVDIESYAERMKRADLVRGASSMGRDINLVKL
uniref:CRAL-TRIO domain-containing protein n=1 Tax=Leersia perrieri TaxID=77586 RepID=A0A0D9WEH1_9ORYZ